MGVFAGLLRPGAGRIPHSALVYDCVDRHSAYGGQMDPALVDRMELELAGAADQVFATAQSLCERLQTANPGSMFIPNGANYERFAQAAQPQPVPGDGGAAGAGLRLCRRAAAVHQL